MKKNATFLTVIVIVWLVASCVPTIPTSTATTTIPISSTATMILTPFSLGIEKPTEIPTLSPSPANDMLIEFLVDKSNSVDMYCGTTGKERFQFVEDMIELLQRHTVSSEDEGKPKFHIGASQFGTDFSLSLIPTNVMEINENFNFQPDNYGRDDTEYVAGIQNAISSMESVAAKDKILIILTDGKFGKESIENIYKTIKPSGGNGLSIYIALLCPDADELQEYVKSWHTYFDGVNGFYILGSAEEAMVQAIEKIKAGGHLSDNFAVRYISYSNIPIEIPGYARKVTLSYWNTSGEALQSTLDKVAIDSLAPNNVATEDINPKAGCGATILQPSPIQSNGILVTTYTAFHNISVSINTPQNMLINFGALDIKVEVEDEGTVGEFGNRRDCFDINLDTLNIPDNLFFPQPCDTNGNFICITDGGNSFYRTWDWIPPLYSDAQDITIRASLMDIRNNHIVTQKTDNIPLFFRPTLNNIVPLSLSKNPHHNYPSEPLVEQIQGEINFEFVKQDPHMYLFSSIEKEETMDDFNKKLAQNDIQFMGCPLVERVEGKLAIDLTNYQQRCDQNYSLEDVLARVCVEEAKLPMSFTYRLEMYSFVFSECGFNTLKISWDEDPLHRVLASSLTCEIKERPDKDIVIICQ